MPVTHEEIHRIWNDADCLWSAERVEAAIDAVASRISGRLEKANPVVLLVMKGGMVFCGKLMERFSFPMELDYIHVSRYGTETFGAELQWMVTPGKSIQGRTVLVVDDILDEGQTMRHPDSSVERATAVGHLRTRQLGGTYVGDI